MILFIPDLGEGWNVARLNDQEEYDFVRLAQRGLSYDRNYFIAGSCAGCPFVANQNFDFSQYSADSGSSYFSIYLNM